MSDDEQARLEREIAERTERLQELRKIKTRLRRASSRAPTPMSSTAASTPGSCPRPRSAPRRTDKCR